MPDAVRGLWKASPDFSYLPWRRPLADMKESRWKRPEAPFLAGASSSEFYVQLYLRLHLQLLHRAGEVKVHVLQNTVSM